MKTKQGHSRFLFLMLVFHSFFQIKGREPSALLTYKEESSLVGTYCPGTISLFCKAVDLTLCRWSYNGGSNVIGSFDTIDTPIINIPSSNPAFNELTLNEVQQDPTDPRFANFSSSLSVNLMELEKQHIFNIICGSLGATSTVPVGIKFFTLPVPNPPVITEVLATYNEGILNSVKISWKKQEFECPSFKTSLVYEVSVSGRAVQRVDQNSCEGSICSTSLTNFPNSIETFTISLMSRNDAGSSSVSTYPTNIEKRKNSLIFSYGLEWSKMKCEVVLICFLPGRNTSCEIQIAQDPIFLSQVNKLTTTTKSSIALPDLDYETDYFFKFSAYLSESLQTTDSIKFTTKLNNCFSNVSGQSESSLLSQFLWLNLLCIFGFLIYGIAIHWIHRRIKIYKLQQPINTNNKPFRK